MQSWLADDTAAAGNIEDLKEWWENLSIRGLDYDYVFPALKSVIVTKPDKLERVTNTFHRSDVVITTKGTSYLGAPISSEAFVADFIEDKSLGWSTKSSNPLT